MAKLIPQSKKISILRRTARNPTAVNVKYLRRVMEFRDDSLNAIQQIKATKLIAIPVSMPSSSHRTAEGETRIKSMARPNRRATFDRDGTNRRKRNDSPAKSRMWAQLETKRGRLGE